jgi:hypothetical protein
MKTRLLSAVSLRFLVAALGALAFLPLGRAEQTSERNLEGQISTTTRTVRVSHYNGPVKIVGVDSGFGWSWTMRVTSGNASEGEAYLKECELAVKETAGTFELELVLPERRGFSRSSGSFLGLFSWHSVHGIGAHSELELRLPRAVAVDLKNRFGTTRVSALSGPVHVEGQNGKVELDDLMGAVTASTSFGALHAQRLGVAALHNQNGAIEASEIAGELRASTSFARMTVHDVKGRVDLKNQNGTIEVSNLESDLLAATSFGRLLVHDVKGHADLRSQNGNIDAQRITGDVAAATSFAELKVADIGGKASLSCQNGRLEAVRVGDDVRASNTFAPLRVQEVRGAADLASQNGDVMARGVEGDVRAKTSFGRMELDGAGKRFDAKNQNGSVTITARSPTVERIAASASFAPIDVRLAGRVQPLIRASTSFGKVRSEYPVLLADATNEAKFHDSTNQPKIDLHGQNGDIRIQQLAVQ